MMMVCLFRVYRSRCLQGHKRNMKQGTQRVQLRLTDTQVYGCRCRGFACSRGADQVDSMPPGWLQSCVAWTAAPAPHPHSAHTTVWGLTVLEELMFSLDSLLAPAGCTKNATNFSTHTQHT